MNYQLLGGPLFFSVARSAWAEKARTGESRSTVNLQRFAKSMRWALDGDNPASQLDPQELVSFYLFSTPPVLARSRALRR